MKNDPKSASRPIVQPVLDRLINLESGLREDPSVTYAQSVRQLKTTLRRDLEWLLNTRRIAVEPPESSGELRRSLYQYGLPEFVGFSATSGEEQARILKDIEETISIFENRLISVRVTMRPVDGIERALYFAIEAILLIDPIPERITFDTVLELSSGEFHVKGEGRA